MLKAFKLNTINMSSQIFTHQPQNNGIQLAFSKMASNYNKKFKYNYKKNMNLIDFNKKQRSHTINLQYQPTEQNRNVKANQASRQTNTKNNKQKIQKRRSNSSQTYVNNFIFHPQKHNKRRNQSYSKQKDQENTNKNKTERTIYKQSIDSEVHQGVQGENQIVKMGTQHESLQAIKQRRKRQTSYSSNTINQKQFTCGTHHLIDKMKSRTTPKTNYTNSMYPQSQHSIQSYKIKSIQLVSPYGNRIFNKKASTSTYPYHLDINHDNNQKEIQFDDIEQIQLQKVKYDNRRGFSNHHCKQRPVTSKPPKLEEFQPKPWQSDEKQELYQKDSISLL